MGYHVQLSNVEDLPKTGNIADILCLIVENGEDENGPVIESSFLYWYEESEQWNRDDHLPPVNFKSPYIQGWFWIYETPNRK